MKLYVGNLPYTTSEEDLRNLFSQYGNVESVAVITDRETGRSKGFGFVEFADDNEAKSAISALSGQEFSGRALTVNEARPKTGGGGGGRGGYGGGRPRPLLSFSIRNFVGGCGPPFSFGEWGARILAARFLRNLKLET